jgi:hypothetical protein
MLNSWSMDKSQNSSTKLFTLLNNSINGGAVLVIKITLATYAANPCKKI